MKQKITITMFSMAGCGMLLLCTAALAGSGTQATELASINSTEQAQAIADYGSRFNNAHVEEYFTIRASGMAEEITGILNNQTITQQTTNYQKLIMGIDKNYKDQVEDNQRMAKSVASEIYKAKPFRSMINLVLNCQYAGSLSIKNAYEDNGSSGPFNTYVVTYLGCVDYFSPESYSIERNGQIKIKLYQETNGNISVKYVQFGKGLGDDGFVETYTYVPTQTLVTKSITNMVVSGNFVYTDFSPVTGGPVGNYVYKLNGKIHDWYMVDCCDGSQHEAVTDAQARSLTVYRSYRDSVGPDGVNFTGDEEYIAETVFKNGSIAFQATAPYLENVLDYSYDFDNLRYVDNRSVYTDVRSLSIDGKVGIKFGYYANPVCTSGLYDFRTLSNLHYDGLVFDVFFPISGQILINKIASVEYGYSGDVGDQYALTSLSGQTGITYSSDYWSTSCNF